MGAGIVECVIGAADIRDGDPRACTSTATMAPAGISLVFMVVTGSAAIRAPHNQ
jgi:hypothetical protein